MTVDQLCAVLEGAGYLFKRSGNAIEVEGYLDLRSLSLFAGEIA